VFDIKNRSDSLNDAIISVLTPCRISLNSTGSKNKSLSWFLYAKHLV